jgi:hypothetical protein
VAVVTSWTRSALWLLAGVCTPAAVALALRPLEGPLPTVAIAELLVLPVVGIAISGRRLAAAAAAVSGALAFDLIYTEPRGSLTIDRADDVVVVAVLVAVGLTISQVVSRARRAQATAERMASDMAVLRDTAELVATGEDAEIVAIQAAFWLRELLGLRDCRLDWSPEPASPAFVDLGGVVRMGPLRWASDVQGLPGAAVDLPMHRNGVVVGRFVLTPEPGRPVLPDRLMTASALADLVAGARRQPWSERLP